MSREGESPLRRALFNQYQAILVGGAAALSAVLANPLPLLVVLGGELVTMPFVVDKLRRRMDLESKIAGRTARTRTLSQEELYGELPAASRARFVRLRDLCDRIQENHRGLSVESQAMLAEQVEKFDTILVSCLRRLWLLKKHEELADSLDADHVRGEVERLEAEVREGGMAERHREAALQNLDIKRRLLESFERNVAARTTLATELDSMESLLQLLLQKSLAGSDANVLAADLDDALAQSEADAASVREMEETVGSLPSLARGERLSDGLRRIAVPPSVPSSSRLRQGEGAPHLRRR